MHWSSEYVNTFDHVLREIVTISVLFLSLIHVMGNVEGIAYRVLEWLRRNIGQTYAIRRNSHKSIHQTCLER